MKNIMIALLAFGASVQAHACPELAGRFTCGIGIPGMTMDVEAKTVARGNATEYTLLGYNIVVDGREQKPNFNVVLRGNTFENIAYTGTCSGKVLNFHAKGRNATKGFDGTANGTIQWTNRGQLSVQVHARWGVKSVKTAALCTPKR